MKNAIRCCISCILPCGALDVIRIVHSNGRVEEISSSIRAKEVMMAHPKHVLKKPTCRPTSDFEALNSHPGGPTIVVVPPDAQLQRGKIYFLIPVHNQPTKKKPSSSSSPSSTSSPSTTSSSPSISSGGGGGGGSTARKKRREQRKNSIISLTADNNNKMVLCNKEGDKYLTDILSEKVVISNNHNNNKDKTRRRVHVWRPRLESICETLSEAASSDH